MDSESPLKETKGENRSADIDETGQDLDLVIWDKNCNNIDGT